MTRLRRLAALFWEGFRAGATATHPARVIAVTIVAGLLVKAAYPEATGAAWVLMQAGAYLAIRYLVTYPKDPR